MKEENIMKILLEGGTKEIIKTEDGFKAEIIDEELDPIECKFYGDYTVNINTKDYKYLILNIDNLETLIEMIHETEDYYRKERKKTTYER
tara:strand:+ start:196 stop:465 length:270 start_codon:yes stop_codon:yes gene_type:complete